MAYFLTPSTRSRHIRRARPRAKSVAREGVNPPRRHEEAARARFDERLSENVHRLTRGCPTCRRLESSHESTYLFSDLSTTSHATERRSRFPD
jgi:hypothetical protein